MKKILLAIVGVMTIFNAHAQDVEGSSDYPPAGRYEGSIIANYEHQDYGEVELMVGKLEGERDPYSEWFQKTSRFYLNVRMQIVTRQMGADRGVSPQVTGCRNITTDLRKYAY